MGRERGCKREACALCRRRLLVACRRGATLAGCGERAGDSSSARQTEQLDLVLDFYVNPDHAGIYEALDKGYFEQAGLEVNPIVPSDPSGPIKQVAAGRADLAISYEPEVLLGAATRDCR